MKRCSRARGLRRYTYALVVSSIILLFLAGCGQAPAAIPSAPADEGPEGEIIIAQGVDATTLDPNMHAEQPTGNVNINIYDSLLMRNTAGELIPGLAESYENLDDNTWEFKLRSGVTFHNGEAFDAEAVKYSLDRILDPENSSPQYSHISAIEEVRVVDAHTVQIITAKPFPTLPAQLVSRQIVPPEYTREMGDDHLASNPVGTGPYRFVEWTRDEEIVLTANEDYWRGTPAIKDVIFRVVPETSTRMAELQTGSVDIIVNVPPHQAETLESGEDTVVSRAPSTRVIFVGMVTTEPGPLTDKRVRQALNYGVDVDAIVENVLMGNGVPLRAQPIAEIHHGYDPAVEAYGHDPDRARDLLSEAGYSEGLEIGMDTPSGRYLMDREVAQAVTGQLEDVGVQADLEIQEWGVYVEKIMSRRLSGLFLLGWGNATFDADATMYPFFRSGQTFCYFEREDLDEMLDVARETMDMDLRLERYNEIVSILSEEAPWIYLHQQMDVYGVSSRIDWDARSDETIHAFDARIKSGD